MKINNIGSTGIVIIYEGPECEDTEVFYPADKFYLIVKNLTTLFEKNSDVLELKPNESIWIQLPECEKFHLNIKINNEKYTIRFKEGSGWVWHLISV